MLLQTEPSPLHSLTNPTHRVLCQRRSFFGILLLCLANSYFGKGNISLQAFKSTLEIRVSLKVLLNKELLWRSSKSSKNSSQLHCTRLIEFDDLHFLITPPVSQAAHVCVSPHPSQCPSQSISDAPKGLRTGASELCPPACHQLQRAQGTALRDTVMPRSSQQVLCSEQYLPRSSLAQTHRRTE